MNKIKKIAAGLTAFSVAATMAACSAPAIGSGTSEAVTIDGYEVKSGVFIFYTLTAYYEARDIVAGDNATTAPTLEEVKEAHIDNLESSEWIQNKATEYCSDFVAVEKEFEKIGGELTDEEIDEANQQVDSVIVSDLYTDNGISADSARDIFLNEYKREHIFDYYYGFEGEKGFSEDELKDYFDDNFARVKLVTLSYLDASGEELDEAGKKKIRDMADDYAEEINSKSGTMDKLYAMNDVIDDYNDYVSEEQEKLAEEQAAATSTEPAEVVTTTTTTTTTTTETETTTTTTTNPYENERIMMKNTTTTASEDSEEAESTTTTTESAAQKSANKLNDYVFGELDEYDTAVVLDDEENDCIYVLIRADLRERMTEDDLWSEDYITSLQSMKFSDEFVDYIKELASTYTAERNKSAYRRYAPFKLKVESDQNQ